MPHADALLKAELILRRRLESATPSLCPKPRIGQYYIGGMMLSRRHIRASYFGRCRAAASRRRRRQALLVVNL